MHARVLIILSVVTVMSALPLAADSRDHVLRFTWRGHAQTASKIVPPGDAQHDAARCGTDPQAVISGAGVTTLLGQFMATQSHCLRLADFSFYGGVFSYTTPDGKTVEGQYRGQFAPALLPPSQSPPRGSVLILGNLCVKGGTAHPRIVDDCAADRYSPARGILNLDTGDGTVFLDYELGIRR